MKKQTKALLCLALVLCFTFSFATPFMSTAFAANPPARINNVVTSGYALFNRVTLENGSYFNKYAKATSTYNWIDVMFGMKYGEAYKRIKKDAYANLYPEFIELKTSGQLRALYMATLENDRHGNALNHPFKDKLAAPNAALYEQMNSSGAQIKLKSYYDSRSHSEDGFWSYGDAGSSVALSADRRYTQLRLVLNHTGCSDGCGSCYIKQQSLVFADLTNPVVSRIYTSADAAGSTPKSAFKQGERVYLHMEFSESIRFANNVFPTGDIKIGLNMMRVSNNQTETGLGATATLYGIQNDMLSFYMDVPATFNNDVEPNHYITGISDGGVLRGTEHQFPLVQVDGEGRAVAHGMSSVPELNFTSSLITDIAGNPYIPNGSTADLAVKCRVDVVKPRVANVYMSSNKVTNEPREAISAGVGETLTFSLLFSEVMDIESADEITATLNITDGSTGQPVTITGAALDNAYRNGVNGVEVTKVTFDPVTVTADMQIANSAYGTAEGDCLPIGIDTVVMAGGFKDISQNVMAYAHYVEAAAGSRVMPSTQIWLDTVYPKITIDPDLDKVGEVYTPIFYGSNTAVFTVPIRVQDENFTDGANHTYQSTAEEQTGSFAFGEAAGNTPRGTYGFEYALTYTQNEVTGGWKAAETGQQISFKQVGENDNASYNYIHIRLLDSVAYDLEQPALTVKGKDFAGNVTTQEFKLNVDADSSGPVITEQAHSYFVDSETGLGSITATVQLTDLRKVDGGALYYAWVNKGANVPSTGSTAGWTQITGYNNGESITGVELTADNLDTHGVNSVERDLIVWARDRSKKENPTTQRFQYSLDAALPSLGITAQQGYNPDPQITVDFQRNYTGGVTENAASTTNLATVIALIADPGAEGYYYMRQYDNYSELSSANTEKSLILGNTDEWFYVKLGQDTTYRPYAEAAARYGNTYSGTAYNAGTAGSGGLESRAEWLQSVSPGPAKTTGNIIGTFNSADVYAYSGTSAGETFAPIGAKYTFTEAKKASALDATKKAYISAILDNTYYGDYTVRLIYGYGGVGNHLHFNAWQNYIYGACDINGTVQILGSYRNRNQENGKNAASADNFVSEVRYYWRSATDDPVYGYALRLNLLNQSLGGNNNDGRAKLNELNMEQPGIYDIVTPVYMGVDYIPQNAVVREESYTFKAVPGSFTVNETGANTESLATHTLSISAESVSGVAEDTSDRTKLFMGEYTGADGGAKYLSTLEKGVLKVEITNNGRDAYGVDDVVFNDPATCAKLYVYGKSEVVAEYPLSAAVQFIGIDDEAVQAKQRGGGRLKLVVSVKTLGGATFTKEYDNIYVDLTRLPEFGPAGVENSYVYSDSDSGFSKSLESKNYPNFDWFENSSGSYDAEVFKIAGAAGHTSTLFFTAKDVELCETLSTDTLQIRVWNAAAGVNEAAAMASAEWRDMDKNPGDYGKVDFRLGYTAQKVTGAAAAAGTPASGKLLLMEGENTIRYQIRSKNNVESAIKSATVLLSSSAPRLEMACTPEVPYASEIRPHVKTLQSASGSAGLKVYHLEDYTPFDIETPNQGGYITQLGGNSGVYYYYTVDQYGNYGVSSLNVSGLLDTAAPVISGFGVTSPAGSSQFTVSATVEEEHIDTVKLYLTVAEGGASSAESVYLPLDMTAGSHEQWLTTPVNGICHITSTLDTANGRLTVSATGGFMGAAGELSRTVTLRAEDGAGNVDTESKTLSGKYSCAEDSTYSLALDSTGLKLTLRDPAIIAEPAGYDAGGRYGCEKLLPVFADGTYPITYVDVAGDNHTINVVVNKFGDFSMAVTRLPEVITNGSVALTLDISANDKLSKLELPASVTDAVWDITDKKVTVTVRENTEFDVTLTRGADSSTKTVPVAVTNIDKTAPVGTLYWYFAEWGKTYSDAELDAAIAAGELPDKTSGEVRAWVSANEPVFASSGDTSFLFTAGGPNAYAFRYQDEAGNSGLTLTATLRVPIVPVPVPDTNAPAYTVELFSSRLGVYGSRGDYDPQATGTNLSLSDWMQGFEFAAGFQLKFRISDESLTKLAVLAGPNANTEGVRFDTATLPPDGADVYGDILTLSKNGAYTVVLVDAANNKTVIELNVTKIDADPPTGTYEVVPNGFYSSRIVVTVTDNTDLNNQNKTITAVDATQGFTMGADGKFYAEVFRNCQIDFRFADMYGLIGSVRIIVSDIDDTEATPSVSWSPSYTNGTARIEQRPPTGPLNYDVTALVTFDKDVKEPVLTYASGGVVADKTVAELHLQGSNRAQVVFHQNAELLLTFKAMNGVAGAPLQLSLVDVIDKTPATVALGNSPDLTTPASKIYFKFTADEPVTDSTGKEYAAGAEIIKTVTTNGTHTFAFTDKAGNVTKLAYNVTNIDDTPPVVLVKSITQVGGAAEIEATMSEAGWLKLISGNAADPYDASAMESYQISAPSANAEWGTGTGTPSGAGFDIKTFTAPQNGSYWLVGVDAAGWVTYELVSVGVIDNQPPVIRMSPVTLSIARGSTPAELTALLADGGVTAKDNVSGSLTPVYDGTGVDLSALGTYVVPYTATDAAGNERKMNRYVVVYDGNSLLVKANGVKTSPASAVVLSGSATVSFTVENLPVADEPYKIYVMAGRRTEGQMKRGTLLTGSSFTATQSGMYTVMILTQSRMTYLTKIYLQF